jgi:sugar lactone lactonase YvrE
MSRYRLAVILVSVCVAVTFGGISCCARHSEYAKPESFIVDPDTGMYYVSNVNEHTREREDNNGYITKLDKDLNVVAQKFIEGGRDGTKLNDPKGMAMVGDTLWVADLKFVRAFDKNTGENTDNVSLEQHGAIFLNGIAAGPDGVLYVSDNQKNKIFAIATKNGNEVSVLVEGNDLNGPNGLYWDADEALLYVACWNGGMVLAVDAEGTISTFVVNPDTFAHLDGIDRDADGTFYVSDYHKGTVCRITPEKRIEVVVDKLTAPADISLDRANNRLLIPLMAADRITVHDLTEDE